jgi:hypothetical protein
MQHPCVRQTSGSSNPADGVRFELSCQRAALWRWLGEVEAFVQGQSLEFDLTCSSRNVRKLDRRCFSTDFGEGRKSPQQASGRRSSWASCVGGRDEHSGDAGRRATRAGRCGRDAAAAAVAWARYRAGARCSRCDAACALSWRFPPVPRLTPMVGAPRPELLLGSAWGRFSGRPSQDSKPSAACAHGCGFAPLLAPALLWPGRSGRLLKKALERIQQLTPRKLHSSLAEQSAGGSATSESFTRLERSANGASSSSVS